MRRPCVPARLTSTRMGWPAQGSFGFGARAALAIGVLSFLGCATEEPLLDGDIIFQESSSPQAECIKLVMKSPWSHMGVLFTKRGKLYVYEAVGPVKQTPFADWVSRGNGRRYVVKRLRSDVMALSDDHVAKMKRVGQRFLGKPYDLLFRFDNDRLYCSELVYLIYEEALQIRLGRIQRLGELDLSHEACTAAIRERFPDGIDSTQAVISPAAIYDSELLRTISSH